MPLNYIHLNRVKKVDLNPVLSQYFFKELATISICPSQFCKLAIWLRLAGSSASLIWAHSRVCSQSAAQSLGATWAAVASAGIPSLCSSSLSSFPQASSGNWAGSTTAQSPEMEAWRDRASDIALAADYWPEQVM